MKPRLALCALTLAATTGCVLHRWTPLAARPQSIDARHSHTVRGHYLNGERLALQGATLSSDTLRGQACVRLAPGDRPDCVQTVVPISGVRGLEARHVDVPLSIAANLGVAAVFLVAAVATSPLWF